MLGKCQNRLNGPFNIFENKGKPNESLNRFNLDSTRFQQAFNIFTFSTMLDDLFKRTEHLVQQSVECKLKQMLKPFKRAFTDAEESYKYLMINFFKLLEIFASHSKWTKRTMMKWTFCLLHWSLQGRHFQTGLVIYIMPKWFSCRLSMRKRVLSRIWVRQFICSFHFFLTYSSLAKESVR